MKRKTVDRETKAERFRSEGIDITIIERAGIEVLEETRPEQDYLNNTSAMSESALRILSCRWQDQPAWVLAPCEETEPFWEWDRYDDLDTWLDTIIAEADPLGLPIMILIDTVTWDDDGGVHAVDNTEAQQRHEFRSWLMKIEFVQSGYTKPDGFAEIMIHAPPEQLRALPVPLPEAIPDALRELLEGVEHRLTEPADHVWFDRQKRKVLALRWRATKVRTSSDV
jgi:hypothetical protein